MNDTTIEDRCGIQFDEQGHIEPWRNQLAADMNQLLGCAQWRFGTWNDDTDTEYALAALRIVARLSESEGIKQRGTV
jgi:hypothetical protein